MVFVHPQVVHFPIALWVVATVFDLVALRSRRDLFPAMSFWLIGLGLVGAVLSVLSGWRDLLAAEASGVGTALRQEHALHQALAYGATAAYLVAFLVRWRRPGRARWTVLLTVLGAVLVGIAGFVGGELRRVM